MSKDTKAKRTLLIAVVWVVIIGVGFGIYSFFSEGSLLEATSSSSQYDHEITVAIDSFSGYAILRSSAVQKELKKKKIRLVFEDDQADYEARLKALKKGKVQMAVFTIDAFILSGAKHGGFPASIVSVIDETKGADAVVAYKSAVARVEDLDSPDARIVLTPSSPSEFLARVILANFELPSLPEKWWEEADGAGDVYKRFVRADKGEKRAFVLWEPYVSKALEEPDAHVLLDSSKLSGYIVDVLVAERGFLKEHPELVQAVVEANLRSTYSYNRQQDGMVALVRDDAKRAGSDSLSEIQAQKLVKGIQWKNTLENYGAFGLSSGSGVTHLEDVIERITTVLIDTEAIKSDPLDGKANILFYDGTLRQLQASGFHPGKKVNVLQGVDTGGSTEQIRMDAALPALSDEQWSKLAVVGNMRVEPIGFARGTPDLDELSLSDLDALSGRLSSFPQYYVRVVAQASSVGNTQANIMLAERRAKKVIQYLESKGVGTTRLNTRVALPGEGGAAQSVSFVVGTVPY